jgi:hypothetical protein
MGTEVLGRYPWKAADFSMTGVWGRPQKASGAHAVPACEVVQYIRTPCLRSSSKIWCLHMKQTGVFGDNRKSDKRDKNESRMFA